MQIISEHQIKNGSLRSPSYQLPKYNPKCYGNKARNQALEKTFEEKREKPQQLFIRCYKIMILNVYLT